MEKKRVNNINKADIFLSEQISKNMKLTEDIVLKAHKILMDGIIPGGIYRTGDRPISIGGTYYEPPEAKDISHLMKKFYADLEIKQSLIGMEEIGFNELELASWAHNEFVSIHPFANGNGRVARFIMNYILQENDLLPLIIKKSEASVYYGCIKMYQGSENYYNMPRNLNPFVDFIYDKEKSMVNDLQRKMMILDNSIDIL